MKARLAGFPQTQVGGSGIGDEMAHASPHLHRIARSGDHHAGHGAHERVVLHSVMRVAERAVGKLSPNRDDRDRQVVVGNVIADLLDTAEGREVGYRVAEDVIAFLCGTQTDCDATLKKV